MGTDVIEVETSTGAIVVLADGEADAVEIRGQAAGEQGPAGPPGLGKDSLRTAVTANVPDLNAWNVLNDGVTHSVGDAVLLTAQTNPAQNGPYIVGTVTNGLAALAPRADFASWTKGSFAVVLEGDSTGGAPVLWAKTASGFAGVGEGGFVTPIVFAASVVDPKVMHGAVERLRLTTTGIQSTTPEGTVVELAPDFAGFVKKKRGERGARVSLNAGANVNVVLFDIGAGVENMPDAQLKFALDLGIRGAGGKAWEAAWALFTSVAGVLTKDFDAVQRILGNSGTVVLSFNVSGSQARLNINNTSGQSMIVDLLVNFTAISAT